jgi:hypothetical protein
MPLKHWRSDPPLTPLAPSWKIPFWVAQCDGPWVDALADLIRQKIPSILSLEACSDGNTGLGPDSLTARFEQYNLLDWPEDPITSLRTYLMTELHQALHALECPTAPLGLQCWANALYDGQQFARHVHSVGAASYLSGNLCLSHSPAMTVYSHIHDAAYTLPFPSKPGQLVLFPSYLPHSTTPHLGAPPRVSIGLDLLLEGIGKGDRNVTFLDR